MRENRFWKRIRETIDWARRIQWLYLLLPAGWKAYLVAICFGGIALILAKLSGLTPAHWYILALTAIAITLITWSVLQNRRLTNNAPPSADTGLPCFSLEFPNELHSYTALDMSIRNCGRSARSIHFDPLNSKNGHHTIRFNPIANLAKDERKTLSFQVGSKESWLIPGVVNHLIMFFQDAPSKTPHMLTIRFLDGTTTRAEQHILEGELLSAGGVALRIYPALRAEAPSEPPLKLRAISLANELFVFLQKQGPKPQNPLSVKGGEMEQRQAFDAYFDWVKDTYFKYMAYYRDRVVKIDFELAANRFFTKLEPREIDPPPTSNEVDVKKIAEALLLTASQIPDSR